MAKILISFLLGASLSANVVLITPRLLEYSLPGAWVASSQPALRGVAPGTIETEVIQTMRTNRTLNTLAFLAAMSLSIPAFATEPALAVEGAYRSLETSNIKTVAESGAQGLAVMNSATANTQALMMQNAASNQQAMNQIQAKMIAQTTVTGAIEGATAVSKINSSDLPALLAQLVAIATAGKQEERIVVQQVPVAQ